jgi:hypothetical protein
MRRSYACRDRRIWTSVNRGHYVLSGDLARPGVGAAHKLHLGLSAVGVSPGIERISVECARALIGAAICLMVKKLS